MLPKRRWEEVASDWFVGIQVVGDLQIRLASEVSIDQIVLHPAQSTAEITVFMVV